MLVLNHTKMIGKWLRKRRENDEALIPPKTRSTARVVNSPSLEEP